MRKKTSLSWNDYVINEIYGCGNFNTWVNLKDVLNESISEDYSQNICDAIFVDVVKDLEACADKDFNIDDLRMAIGRVLCDRLGIER